MRPSIFRCHGIFIVKLCETRFRGSPDYLYRELNLSGRRLSGGNQPSVANRISRGIKNVPIIQWRSKICVVQHVKEFRAELNIESIRNSLNGIVLEYRKIETQ